MHGLLRGRSRPGHTNGQQSSRHTMDQPIIERKR